MPFRVLHPPQRREDKGLVATSWNIRRDAIGCPFGRAIGKTLGKQHLSRGRTRGDECVADRGRRKAGNLRLPNRLGSPVAHQIDDRIPATRNGDRVSFDDGAVIQQNAGNGFATENFDDPSCKANGNARRLRVRPGAAVDDGFDTNAEGFQIARRSVAHHYW